MKKKHRGTNHRVFKNLYAELHSGSANRNHLRHHYVVVYEKLLKEVSREGKCVLV